MNVTAVASVTAAPVQRVEPWIFSIARRDPASGAAPSQDVFTPAPAATPAATYGPSRGVYT